MTPSFKQEPLLPEPPDNPHALSPVITHRLDFVQLGLPEYKHKFAMVIDNLFTPQDCARYLAKVESEHEWKTAGVGALVVDTSYRNSSRILFDDQELASEMFAKLRPYLEEIEHVGDRRLVGLNPRLRFLKYGPGQFFQRHCDGTYSSPDKTQTSYYTLQLYLHDSPLQGGATRFWKMGNVDGPERRKSRPGMTLRTWVDVEPRVGRALIFEQRGLVHSGEQVVSGTKFTVRTDFMFECVFRLERIELKVIAGWVSPTDSVRVKCSSFAHLDMFAVAVSVLLTALLVSADRSLSPMLGIPPNNSSFINVTVAEAQIQHVFTENAVDHSSGHFLSKRARYIDCAPNQQVKLLEALRKVKQYASSSHNHLKSNPAGSTLYTKWFGQFSPERYARVLTTFDRLRTYPDKWAYSCNLCTTPSVLAKVDESKIGIIDLCPRFWIKSTVVEGIKSRAYSIIREGTRVKQVLGAGNRRLSQETSEILATQNPTEAVESAEILRAFRAVKALVIQFTGGIAYVAVSTTCFLLPYIHRETPEIRLVHPLPSSLPSYEFTGRLDSCLCFRPYLHYACFEYDMYQTEFSAEKSSLILRSAKLEHIKRKVTDESISNTTPLHIYTYTLTMSEPTVTSTSSTHSAPISKPHPHSVAHEEVPPESHPIGSEEHGTTGPTDAPPGTAEGEQYPPQLHAGKVGYGPHYAEVHGKDTGLGAKVTGLKEQLKGKITRNHELEQKGKERKTGALAAKQQAEDDTNNPFQHKEEEGGQNPVDTENKGATNPAKGTELTPGANKTDTDGGPTVERIPSSSVISTAESRTGPSTKSQDIPTKSQGAPTVTTERDIEGTPTRH
ncbi:2OG-Fe(II) oxygenase family protein [Rhizoctonia solani AG-3 Rhs1AP]|nr:2OG-Fe(II) oxygenase family protein [Rhizoctonia solani AG-3 Rhs1AP]